MIIHTYLTDGFLEWGKLFLESYKYHNGEDKKIIMDTRDLNKKQIKSLYKLYSNLEVKNKKIDYNEVAKRARIDVNKIKAFKERVENQSVDKDSKYWKLYVSVEDRYRNTIKEAIEDNMHEDYLLHMDIDMYVRDKLNFLFNLIKKYDISIRFRNKKGKKTNDNRKVLGNIIGFRICDEVLEFMNIWRKHIDAVPLYKMEKGYGQASFWYAYKEHENNLKWGNIPETAKTKAAGAILWTGNKGRKNSQLKKCREDFNKKIKW